MNFSGQTDSAQKFKVKSNLIYAIWNSKAAYGNCEATFEVRTSLVGDGAEVKIKAKTENGKSLGKLDAKIFGNRLIAGFPIPKNVPADDLAYLEVQLPKQNLKGETNRIPTRPPIQVQQMKWSAKEARRGDVLTLIVDFQSQIPNDTDALIIIKEYDQNGRHDPICKIPTTVQHRRIQVQWKFDYSEENTRNIPVEQELLPLGRHYEPPKFFFIVNIDDVIIGIHQESGIVVFNKDEATIFYKIYNNNLPPQFKLYLADGNSVMGKIGSDGYGIVKDVMPGRFWIEYLL